MSIEVYLAAISDKPVLRNLLELCQHDYSEFDNVDVDEHGLFGYKYLDNYWTESGRYPFLFKAYGKLAGFALVRDVDFLDKGIIHSLAEFFVMRKYRRQGVGRQVAWSVFDRFPGSWIVYQEQGNLPAQHFWRRVINEYTQGRYADENLQTEEWQGPCQTFESRVVNQ